MTCSGGTRASANTSGSDPTRQKIPGDIANLKRFAPNEESLFLLPNPSLESASTLKTAIQPLDLMSRRHPLVDQSTGLGTRFMRSEPPDLFNDAPA